MALLLILGTLAMIPVGVIVNGYVLSVLWSWFVVTTFGAPPLLLPNAIGLACVVGYMTHHYRPSNDNDKEGLELVVESFLHALIKPSVALLFGWVIKQWM